jgi:ubiquinone/menaquinone biosynthesis C-methylase UbiE
LKELGWELNKPRPILVELVENGQIKKGKALDICCGAGTNTVYLAAKGFEVVGIDISSKAIEIAKEKAKRANVTIQFRVENFLRLPFEDEEFDFVFDMGCFHHVETEDRQKFIDGVHRVLKKKGNYLLTRFSYKNGSAWNHFAKKHLIALFSKCFDMNEFRHYASVEGDGVTRCFYTVLMVKRE